MQTRDHRAAIAWLNSRLTLDIFRITRAGLIDDPVATVLLAAISNANTVYIDARPEQSARYMPLGAISDDLRRPASISSLARSLGVPRETARGKALALVELGLIEARREGYVLPAGALTSGPVARTMGDYLEVIDRLIRDLGGLEAFELQSGAGLTRPHMDVAGGVVRLTIAHLLRSVAHALGLVRELSLSNAYVMTAVVHLTGAHFSVTGQTPPETIGEVRQGPVRGAAVATYLDMPLETVRRQLKKLSATGRLEETSQGYVVRFDPSRRHLWDDMQEQALVNTRQLVWRLKAVGALAD
jgi:DNA-binding transcriptional ArsR family regulator